MLREIFGFHLAREPNQTFDSWVVTVKERAAECKFPPEFLEQAVRDKLTFTCADDRSKLKLYDVGAPLTLDKAITILSMKEATNRELQESKTATIESIRQAPYANSPDARTQSAGTKPQFRRQEKCGYCGRNHPRGKVNCPAANTHCNSCSKVGHFAAVCGSKPDTRVSQVQGEGDSMTQHNAAMFVGMVNAGASPNHADTQHGPELTQTTGSHKKPTEPGWHIKLQVNDKELTWCIDTGAQVSVMPESMYETVYGKLSTPDKHLVGAGESPLATVGQTTMHLKIGQIEITEQVYVVRGATKLLLDIPAIHSFGILHDIPNTYSVKAIACSESSPELDTKAKVLQQYPSLFTGLGKLKGEYTIRL